MCKIERMKVEDDLRVTSTTTLTLTKNNVSMELSIDEIASLLQRLNWSEHLAIFDDRTTKVFTSSPDEVSVSVNGDCIQITLLAEDQEMNDA